MTSRQQLNWIIKIINIDFNNSSLIVFKIMNDQDLNKCITKYFKQPKVDSNNLVRIINYADQFSSRNMQQQMIQKLFRAAEQIMEKNNIKFIIKRYLHLINKLLEKDDKLLPQFKYQNSISVQIVPQFTKMLKTVMNGPIELLPQMKMFRKRCAKRISDHAYYSIQNEAQKQLKVDLEKGFPEDTIQQLEKQYRKRQFTKSEIEKYLPMGNGQSSYEARKTSAVVSSDSSQSERGRKKFKRQSQDRVQDNRNQYNDMVMHRLSYIPSNTHGFAGDPRRSNQILNPNRSPPPPQIIYHPSIYPSAVNNSTLGDINFPVDMNSVYHHGNFHYPPTYYPQNIQSFQNGNQYRFQIQNPVPSSSSSKYHKILMKVDLMKKNWFFQCKFCGLMMSTSQKYEEHMYNHFNQSQKQYETSHSRTDHNKKGNKSTLPTAQEWIQSGRIKFNEQKFEVIIEGNMNRDQKCIICKGQLKVAWSDEVDTWVYEDAIKTKIKDSDDSTRYSICHAQCYHTVNDLEKSSDQNSK